jgi:hypothetical protein
MSTLQKIRNWSAALLFVATFGGATLAVALPQTSYAAACNDRLLTFPAWYKGLQTDNCDIKSPGSSKESLSKFIWTIVLNVIEIMLQAVGYLSIGYIIAGGYKYIISAGSPDGMVKARKTIVNAVVGLIISIFSVAIVNAIAGALKG